MRLLVITQKIDSEDPVLGFFHEWAARLAGQCDSLDIICLWEGAHDLPQNVRVHSLGKERGASRLAYVLRLWRYACTLRYDAVFVHMNEEYVLLCGPLWRLLRKRVVLWRNHPLGSWRTRLAMALATAVCYTSTSAYVARSPKGRQMPIGIDTERFAPAAAPAPAGSVLFLGRLDPIKKAEVFVEALGKVAAPLHADLVGSPSDPASPYATQVAAAAEPLVRADKLTLGPGVPQERAGELFRTHALYINLTPSGSFDKTIGEAMASGCLVACANDAVRDVLPQGLFIAEPTAAATAAAIEAALRLGPAQRAAEAARLRAYVVEQHSLTRLMRALIDVL